MVKKLFGLSLTALVLAAPPASAQLPGVDVEGYAGVFIPATDVIEEQILGTNFTAGQKNALALGGRVTLWLLGPLGVEGTFNYAFSDAQVNDGTTVSDTSANVWAASGRAVLRFGVPAAPVSFFINGGIAYVSHGGDAYDFVTKGESDVGGVVGVGLKVGLPMSKLAIRVDAEDYIYSAKMTLTDPDSGITIDAGSQLQSDIVLSAGLVVSIGP